MAMDFSRRSPRLSDVHLSDRKRRNQRRLDQHREDTGKSQMHVWETGKVYWLPATAPNTKYADVNKRDKPIKVMVVKLKHEQ
jgi:hypothetical protein